LSILPNWEYFIIEGIDTQTTNIKHPENQHVKKIAQFWHIGIPNLVTKNSVANLTRSVGG